MNEQAKTKKGSIFSGIGQWFREFKSEVKKVVWPSFGQVVKNTLVVIATVLIVGIFVWAVDFVFDAARLFLMGLQIK